MRQIATTAHYHALSRPVHLPPSLHPFAYTEQFHVHLVAPVNMDMDDKLATTTDPFTPSKKRQKEPHSTPELLDGDAEKEKIAAGPAAQNGLSVCSAPPLVHRRVEIHGHQRQQRFPRVFALKDDQNP
ncbi:hypothetical protein MKZ38_003915 [Zalerion maritima]|uniref:Uncharacterized protein n=1 Tax=Zalerion maritima TaxID=339359 RepID=A0AAD5WQB6_9PEZI|nr:hypothetical protein MKZ38_003915 [Zalerion maritima]